MNTALILHGKPSKEGYYDPSRESQSNEHWIPWLQRQLLLKDILTQTPEWPKPYEPNYQAWSDLFNQFKVDENTTLIGHSCGAGFLVRWLSENKIKVGKVILVAPWLNSRNTEEYRNFFNFTIDPELINRTKGITIFYSTDDDIDIIGSVDLLREKIPGIKLKEFTNYKHFTFKDMKTREFPELLEEALNR